MTKAELIERIARSRELPQGVSKREIAQILDIAFGEIVTYFGRAKITRTQSPRFAYPGFGTFTKKRRRARKGINPRTLQPIEIEASFTIDFRVATALRTQMNEPGRASSRRKQEVAARASQGGHAFDPAVRRASGGAEPSQPNGAWDHDIGAPTDATGRGVAPSLRDALIGDPARTDDDGTRAQPRGSSHTAASSLPSAPLHRSSPGPNRRTKSA